MSPFTKVTVAAGSSITSLIERPLSTGRKPRLSSSRSGLKYSHLSPGRTSGSASAPVVLDERRDVVQAVVAVVRNAGTNPEV